MKKLLGDLGYDQKSAKWLKEYLNEFVMNVDDGFACINNYSKSLGDKDTKALENATFKNKILMAYNAELSSNATVRKSKTKKQESGSELEEKEPPRQKNSQFKTTFQHTEQNVDKPVSTSLMMN